MMGRQTVRLSLDRAGESGPACDLPARILQGVFPAGPGEKGLLQKQPCYGLSGVSSFCDSWLQEKFLLSKDQQCHNFLGGQKHTDKTEIWVSGPTEPYYLGGWDGGLVH